MSRLIHFPESSAIAVHAMVFLAGGEQKAMAQSEILKAFEMSEAHLAKVLQRLRQAGLVDTVRGPAGGFFLTRPPEEISLLEVHEAIQGAVKPTDCLIKKPMCSAECACEIGATIGKFEREIKAYLGKTSLADVNAALERRKKKLLSKK